MQTTVRCGSALPGDNGRQRSEASRATSRNQRGNAYPRQIQNTPQSLLPKRMRQAYIDENATLLQLRTEQPEQYQVETF